jgi:uncharacterized membrane protein
MKRIASIDITRGIVMVIMALDHVRDLMHVNSITQSPTNLQTTSPALFFTRWITYLCAPTFVFLAGTSAYLSWKKNNDTFESRAYLIKRGIYLLALEFIVVNFLLFFDPLYHTIIFEVIATIGFGFIILGSLLNVRTGIIGVLGLILIFGHDLSSFIPLADNSFGKNILSFFFSQAALPLSSNRVFVMAYPPLPWLGIMLAGFATGKFFERSKEKRTSLFMKIGFAAFVLFIVIRFINTYGNPFPWSIQHSAVFTFLSFMNVSKYPPSLQFCLITLSIMFFILSFTERPTAKVLQMIAVYGKVPLFYFLLHFLVIHLLMLALLFLQGFSWSQLDFASGNFGRPKGIQSGVVLWVVYLIWISVVVILYKPCVWYGKYKSEHPHWWLKYL